MCSLKKYALIGVAALTAFTISCSDDEGGDGDDKKFEVKKGEAALGGIGSTDYGSSLDIDADNKVYMLSEVTASVANDIDVIFDGTNIWTPHSIKSAGSDIAAIKNKYTSSTSDAFIFKVSSSTTTEDDLREVFTDLPDDEPDAVISSVSTGKKFGVLTSDGDKLVLVTVKEKGGQNILVTLMVVE